MHRVVVQPGESLGHGADEMGAKAALGQRRRDHFRQADFIEGSIRNLQHALFEGGIIVTVILFIFLMNFRASFISFLAMLELVKQGVINVLQEQKFDDIKMETAAEVGVPKY